jgi:hypothetical protein
VHFVGLSVVHWLSTVHGMSTIKFISEKHCAGLA